MPKPITFKSDRSFYIGDEYGASIYYFDPNGNLRGTVGIPEALIPRTAGAINFNSVNPGDTGRRNNQGIEALGLTPDGNKLVAIMQSATVQDTNGANQQTRNNTRILMYDVSQNATPNAPVASYVRAASDLHRRRQRRGDQPHRRAKRDDRASTAPSS